MATERLAIPELARLFEGGTVSGLSEWQLLERYLERRDESAFEALVVRHGPMVLSVCRRALGVTPDADDAFQATFLILIRRARALGPRDAIGPWLYGVARRVAARARDQAARRRRREPVTLDRDVEGRPQSSSEPDVSEILDQELNRLPARYRSPMVLCYLEGRTHEEAARDLGWPVGTVKGRLARAREILRDRLTRRGLEPMSGVVLAARSLDLRGILDRVLIDRVVGTSVRMAAGHSVAQAASQSISSLVQGALSSMFYRKIATIVLVACASGVAVTTTAVMARQEKKGGPGGGTGGRVYGKAMLKKAGEPPETRAKTARIIVLPYELQAARVNDPKSRQILEKLEEPIAMSFANETPLEQILKYIKQTTTTENFNGIPIYVDPIGLQEAERSLNSTVQIDLEGVPLRRTLQLLLAQLGLIYFVEDGVLVITNADAEAHLPPTMQTPPPILEKLQKAERGEMTVSEMKELMEFMQIRRQLHLMKEAMETPYGGETHGGGRVGEPRVFPGEEHVRQTSELLGEVRELVRILKQEKSPEKPAKKADEPKKSAAGIQ